MGAIKSRAFSPLERGWEQRAWRFASRCRRCIMVAGAESLSDKEHDLYQNLVQELKSDGTLSSEMSDIFTYMSMSPSQDLR